jgi:hypothetical protein
MDQFDFDRVTRDLTTDQGLPLDASRAVAISLGEEPVFRSIAMEAAPPVGALRFYEPPSAAKRHEVMIDAPLQKPVLKPALRVVRAQVEVPSVDEQLAPLERTKFEVSGTGEAVKRELVALLTALCVAHKEEAPFELLCTKCCDESFQKCTFVVRLLKANHQTIVVEMQRRGGCPRLFNFLFRNAKAHWHKCAQVNTKPLAAPRLQRSSSESPCAALAPQSPEQWNCLVNWMDSDACEAIRCVAALANQGAVVPDHVIAKLVTFLSSEYKVEAMQAISAAVPHSQLSGQEDAVFRAVSESLSSGSSIEEREACKLVAKLSAELPHLLRRPSCDFADKLAAASRSQWTCVREFAAQSLAVLHNATEVH